MLQSSGCKLEPLGFVAAKPLAFMLCRLASAPARTVKCLSIIEDTPVLEFGTFLIELKRIQKRVSAANFQLNNE